MTELLEGETLRAVVSRGPCAWHRVAEIGAALADGQEKVLDFNLAIVDTPSTTETRTLTGMVAGTPGYMSPEQIRGEQAGPLSDIFSLGCVLHEMVSGKRAFAGHTAMETMSKILRDEAAELTAPVELKRLIERCLDKRLEGRMHSARELAAQLRALLNAPSGAAAVPAVIDSIALLPFHNASNDPDSEYLSDGITESILNSLAQIPQLRVLPRRTVFRYKGSDKDPQAVGTELLDVQAGSQLWGERFNRNMSDIFALEEEILQKLSGSLRVRLSGEEKKRLGKRVTADPEAYQLYLKGRHHWVKRTPEDLQTGARYFQQAIERDPRMQA